MAIDKKYVDNVVLKQSALQNLLTNIKNYPIIDIDYIEPEEVDEQYKDDIWQNYTEGSPCIKITYGDSNTTKGNVMFHNSNRATIDKIKKEIARLETIKSQLSIQKSRWLKIKETNEQQLITKNNQIHSDIIDQFESTLENKYNFLVKIYGFFNFNELDSDVGYQPITLIMEGNVIKGYNNTLNPSNEDIRNNLFLYHYDSINNEYIEDVIEYDESNPSAPKARIIGYNSSYSYFNQHTILYDSNEPQYNYTYPTSFTTFTWATNYMQNSDLVNRDIKLQLLNEGWCLNTCNALTSFAETMTDANQKDACYKFIDFLQQYNNLVLLDTINSDENIAITFIECTDQDQYQSSKTYYYKKNNKYYLATYSENETSVSGAVGPWIQNMSGFYYIPEAQLATLNEYITTNYQPVYGLDNIYNSVIAQIQNIVSTILKRLNQNISQAISHLNLINNDMSWLNSNHLDINTITTEWYKSIENIKYLGVLDSGDHADDNIVLIDNNEIIVSNGQVVLDGTILKKYDGTSWININNDNIIHLFQSDKNIGEKFSISDYQTLIRYFQDELNNGGENSHGLVRGYKYVKVGGGIGFTHNKGVNENNQEYDIWTKISEPQTTPQRNGHFRIDLNNEVYEVGIKGLNLSSTSALFVNTNTVLNGTLFTENGNIYASGGAVIGSTYLGIRAYGSSGDYVENTTNSGKRETAGLWFDGKEDLLKTYNITKLNDNIGFQTTTAIATKSLSTPQIYTTSISAYNATISNTLAASSITASYIYSTTATNVNLNSTNANLTNIVATYIDSTTANFELISATTASFTQLNTTYLNGKNIQFINNTTQFLRRDGAWTDSLTGPFKSSYQSGTWNNSLSNAAFTLTDITTGFNGWICGPTHDGRIAISTYPNSDNKLYFGYRDRESLGTNSYLKKMTWDGSTGYLTTDRVYNAVYNDYAEYRKTILNVKPGQCVYDNDDGSLSISDRFLIPGAQIVSDTFGHVMGETDDCKTPLAVAGRVLVYTYQPRENYHAGMCVCSAPGGTVNIMSRKDIQEYPDCIVGIVSEIPDYEYWGTDNVKVDGRIWIKVK